MSIKKEIPYKITDRPMKPVYESEEAYKQDLDKFYMAVKSEIEKYSSINCEYCHIDHKEIILLKKENKKLKEFINNIEIKLKSINEGIKLLNYANKRKKKK